MAEDHRISNYSFVLVFNVHIPQFPFCLFSLGYFLVKGGSSPRASPSVLSSHSFALCPFAVPAIIHIHRIYSCFISRLTIIYFFRVKSVFVQFSISIFNFFFHYFDVIVLIHFHLVLCEVTCF